VSKDATPADCRVVLPEAVGYAPGTALVQLARVQWATPGLPAVAPRTWRRLYLTCVRGCG